MRLLLSPLHAHERMPTFSGTPCIYTYVYSIHKINLKCKNGLYNLLSLKLNNIIIIIMMIIKIFNSIETYIPYKGPFWNVQSMSFGHLMYVLRTSLKCLILI